jgi:exosortase
MNRRAVILLSAAALIWAYAPTLRMLFGLWWNDEDLGHCFAAPFVVLWVVWREREGWQKVPMKPSWWGLPVLAVAAVMQIVALMGLGPFTGSVAFLVSVAGTVISLGGFALLRAWAFPLMLTLFMLPKLVIVYNQLTLPLQLLASRLAAGILSLAGLMVERQGNVLNVTGHQVAVLEACNGMRYLLSLGFVAVVFAYLADSRPWMRWAMLAAAAPVAILGNALRVAAVGYSPRLEAGTPHLIVGWVIFLLCLAMLGLSRRLIGLVSVRAHA